MAHHQVMGYEECAHSSDVKEHLDCVRASLPSDVCGSTTFAARHRRVVKVGVGLAMAVAVCLFVGLLGWRPSALRPDAISALYGVNGTLDAADQASVALCTIDAWQAMGRLGQLVIAIDKVTEACEKEDKSFCSGTVSSIITQTSLLAALLSSAASDCALTLNVKARCASKVTGLVGNLAATAVAGSNVYRTCSASQAQAANEAAKESVPSENKTGDALCTVLAKPEHKALDSPEFRISELLRQQACLGEAEARRSGPDAARQREIASCFFDVVQVTGFFSRMGLGINGAVKGCSPDSLDKPDGKRRCSVTVLGIIGSFFLGAQFLANALTNCPVEGSVSAQCSRDILGLIGTITSSATFATDLLSCEGVYNGDKISGLLPVDEERRLSAQFPEKDS